MSKTNIEWSEQTWNPTVGCSEVSAGCRECYAAKMAYRLAAMGQEDYKGLTKKLDNGRTVWTGEVRTLQKRLSIPFKNKKPTVYFVDSMSDLFHEEIGFLSIDAVFRVMNDADWHTFQVLTKRPERALQFYEWKRAQFGGIPWQSKPHVQIGVSVEDQKAADKRIPLLLQIPADVRFLSCEPLLGPVGLTKYLWTGEWLPSYNDPDNQFSKEPMEPIGGLQWVITGGESGPQARACKTEWMQEIVEQCKAAAVPVFVKQLGKILAKQLKASDAKGGNINDFPECLKVREFPETVSLQRS